MFEALSVMNAPQYRVSGDILTGRTERPVVGGAQVMTDSQVMLCSGSHHTDGSPGRDCTGFQVGILVCRRCTS